MSADSPFPELKKSHSMARNGRLRGRGLLVGGGFYVAYLALVGAALTGVISL